MMLAFSQCGYQLGANHCQPSLRRVTVEYHPSVKSLLRNDENRNNLNRNMLRNIPSGKRSNVSLLASPDEIEKIGKYEIPPFQVKDKYALLYEIGLIFISQLLIGLYTTLNSPDFPGWMSPVTASSITSPRFTHAIEVSAALSLFWIVSRWWSRSLQRDLAFFRFKDAFDATWQQWIAVANLYIASSLVYSFVNHVGVTGIETPLLSGAVAILVARVLYYGIPI